MELREALQKVLDLSESHDIAKNQLLLQMSGHKCGSGSHMTPVEAFDYASNTMGFGQYANRKVQDVPLDYLEWVADQNLQLQRYLRTIKGQ